MILSSHGFEAALSPSFGGLLRALRWRGHDLLHAPHGAVPSRETPNRFGLWPLAPFCNRAFDAVIDDGHCRFTLPVNDPARGAAIHGFAWQSEWQVLDCDTDSATLAHRRHGRDDPYHYDCRLGVALRPGHVEIALAVTNLADHKLPFGIGLHPWFPCAADTTLQMQSAGALVLGEGYRPLGHGPVPAAGNYAQARQFRSAQEVAWSYSGWDGQAVIETPSLGLACTITASESLRCPVLWAPPDAPFLCLEPQSHGIGAPSDAAGRAATPLARLKPGETLAGWMRIAPAEIRKADVI